ncbi:MAG TPA: PSD1 and planctomycete cytochrome C domain-containing protein [Planctomycetota bacterium]|nr:PSD1 and planctomycete cytochrome C domain-containing protein [Planctomycetota bacterium]
MKRWIVLVLGLLAAPVLGQEQRREESRVSFRRDILPILSQNCFACHGPDRKNASSDLRLDTREGALAAIVPGKPAESEVMRRIATADAGERMPPRKSGKKLTSAQVALLRRWIEQGAEWEAPWALTRPRRSPLPAVRDAAWVRTPIDRFILARLEQEGLRPAPEADRAVLLRRVSFDLTGLPPSIEDVDAFLADAAPDAYERVVERLLASPRYGERMALEWLDAARYADTHGLHVDSHRDMWPWRDQLIRSFNANQPFDQFTLEQLAGDLLPNATTEQKIASGFNRNHMISYQNSSIPEKVRTAYVVDRVNTTGTVWLGLTLACAQCHDHKFDPIPQLDYYRLFAFFNTITEKPLDGDKGNAVPLLVLDPEGDAKLADLARKAAGSKDEKLTKTLRQQEKELLAKTPSAMVMQEMVKPRLTFLLDRGEYDQPREKVEPGTPGCLPPMAPGLPRNRLGLARWLVDPSHPLTARVQVNRLWQMLFGRGIVETSEDFGAQGDGPSHPELLDTLAVEFVESGWDVKAMLRRLVTSAVYRQSSKVAADALARDPRNRLLSRGPRFRLPAEMIRDGALVAGGLLRERIGGPSVFPYQPAGVWEAVASGRPKEYTAQVYRQDHGINLYRRSLYTFWKRLAPPPALAAFDAPSREACVVRRQRTNTPLQALAALNDPGMIEAARGLATRTLKEAETADDERITWAFRVVLARRPNAAETAILAGLLREQRRHFAGDLRAATSLVEVGETPRDARLDVLELATWTMVSAAILNLDETLTKG